MATQPKSKEIQVQKPAQSLQAFQKKLSTGEDLQTGILKPILITAGAAVVVLLAIFGFMAHRARVVERYEATMGQILADVNGDPLSQAPGTDVEKHMRENLPRLQALVQHAPGSRKAAAASLLAAWQLELDGKTAVVQAPPDGPWASLRLAQRQVNLAQGKEALATLAPLRHKAGPDEAWASLYWTTLLQVDELQGNRDQAWKDFAEYKARFKEKADLAAMERTLAGI
jgi:hypothetical protein